MREGTPKMLDFLGLAWQALVNPTQPEAFQESPELANVAAMKDEVK